jgi:hypothetical protein
VIEFYVALINDGEFILEGTLAAMRFIVVFELSLTKLTEITDIG